MLAAQYLTKVKEKLFKKTLTCLLLRLKSQNKDKINPYNENLISTNHLLVQNTLNGVSATFLLVCFVSLNESTCEKRKNVFYFTSIALFVLEIIKF